MHKDIVLYLDNSIFEIDHIKILKKSGYTKLNSIRKINLNYKYILLKEHDKSITLIDYGNWACKHLEGEISKGNLLGMTFKEFTIKSKLNYLVKNV